MTGKGAAIDVAVGVVIRGDSVLLGQRVVGKPYAGWWEFPGGKVEPGETIARALARELHEELGLEVRASLPWVVREFSYPHARVRLHFRRVFDFDGEPVGREGQAFAWARYRARIEQAPLLPATVPAIGWLRLPSLCIDCAAAAVDLAELSRALGAAAPDDSPIILLDGVGADPDEFEALFYRVRALAAQHRAPLLVDAACGPSYGRSAHGVVLAGASLHATAERPQGALVAARCESAHDLAHAARIDADFALAPAPLVRACAPTSGVPLFAHAPSAAANLTSFVREARQTGAHGVALVAAHWLRAQRCSASSGEGSCAWAASSGAPGIA